MRRFCRRICSHFSGHKVQIGERFCVPVYGKPRTGLLRTFCEPDGVLRSPLRGLCVQGAFSCPTRRAFLCTLYTETFERAGLLSGSFRNPQPLVFSQKYRRYKWEAYCGTNGRCTAAFPFFQSFEASEAQRYKCQLSNGGRTAVQIRGVPPVLFRQVVRVGGS